MPIAQLKQQRAHTHTHEHIYATHLCQEMTGRIEKMPKYQGRKKARERERESD